MDRRFAWRQNGRNPPLTPKRYPAIFAAGVSNCRIFHGKPLGTFPENAGVRPSMATILVTGAAGFIGAATSHALLARGDRVIGIDNLNAYYDVTLQHAR